MLRRAKTLRERAQIKYVRTKHRQKQHVQRQKFYKHRRKAIQNPKKYSSIIGVKVHRIINYAYIADETVPRGGNLIFKVLRLTLNDLQNREELPSENPVLYLQMWRK